MLIHKQFQAAKTKSDFAYEALKKEIIEGAYQPGERIIIQPVACRYGMSDIPVREALKRLEAHGFVVSEPHIGYTVTTPNFESDTELFFVRQLLEGNAARLAAENISEKALKKLQKLHAKMIEISQGDMVKFSALNYQFHDIIYSSSANSILYKFVQQAWAMSPRTRSIFSLFPERATISCQDHEKILLALEARDSAKAMEAMLKHKGGAYQLLFRYRAPEDETELLKKIGKL